MSYPEFHTHVLVYADVGTVLTATSETIESSTTAKARLKSAVELWLTESKSGLEVLATEGAVPSMADVASKGYLQDRTLVSVLADHGLDDVEVCFAGGVDRAEDPYGAPIIGAVADVLAANADVVAARYALTRVFSRLSQRLTFGVRDRPGAEVGGHVYFLGNHIIRKVMRVPAGSPVDPRSPDAIVAFSGEMSLRRHGWSVAEMRSLTEAISAWLDANPRVGASQ